MSDSTYLYLDYAASAPMLEVAKEAMQKYQSKWFAGANPNSLHSAGKAAQQSMEAARKIIAKALGAGFRPADIIFTSGGTESNNLALLGLAEAARAKDARKKRVIVSALEHDSVLDVITLLHERGFEVSECASNSLGLVTSEALRAAFLEKCEGKDVSLVSIMSANNETGIVQPIDELAETAHSFGALMHTDAVQAFGKIELALDKVDAVSIAAHKIGGPVGVAVLALRPRIALKAQSLGGGQERGWRPGTQDVESIVGFAAASAYCVQHLQERRELSLELTRYVYKNLCEDGCFVATVLSGYDTEEDAAHSISRLPGMVSVMNTKLDSETLVLKLDAAGFAVSAGSACSSGSLEISHVLRAMGKDARLARGSLRISFDERVSKEELDRFIEAARALVV